MNRVSKKHDPNENSKKLTLKKRTLRDLPASSAKAVQIKGGKYSDTCPRNGSA